MKSYYIKERLIAIGAKFDVYDESGRVAYLVEADKFDIGKNISIYTPDKSVKVLYLKQVLRLGAHKYKIYGMNGEQIGEIQKEFMTPTYHITGEYGDIDMVGKNLLGRSYSIRNYGKEIGTIEKELTLGRDRYDLQVYDVKYTEILIGLLIMVDMVRFHSDQK